MEVWFFQVSEPQSSILLFFLRPEIPNLILNSLNKQVELSVFLISKGVIMYSTDIMKRYRLQNVCIHGGAAYVTT